MRARTLHTGRPGDLTPATSNATAAQRNGRATAAAYVTAAGRPGVSAIRISGEIPCTLTLTSPARHLKTKEELTMKIVYRRGKPPLYLSTRGGQMASRLPHKQEKACSTHAPATKKKTAKKPVKRVVSKKTKNRGTKHA